MSKINVRSFSNENDDGAPDIVGVSTFSATSYFVPTKGNTQQRPSDHVEVGSLRFNTDTSNLEYYKGDTLGWSQFELIDPELGGGTGSNTGLGTRALFGGGHSPGYVDTIDFITISTLGNAQDFGDFAGTDRGFGGGASSRTRALFMGGYTGSAQNDIDFNIFASLGNSTDFGNLTSSKGRPKGMAADQVRALFAGGDQQPSTRAVDFIDYVTMAQEGNAVDFGDLTDGCRSGTNSTMGSSTRGVFPGGNEHPSRVANIDFVTVATLGNASDFGDLTAARRGTAAARNGQRGL